MQCFLYIFLLLLVLLLFMRQRVVCAMLCFLTLWRSNRDVFAYKKCIKTPNTKGHFFFANTLLVSEWSFLTFVVIFIYTYFLLIAHGRTPNCLSDRLFALWSTPVVAKDILCKSLWFATYSRRLWHVSVNRQMDNTVVYALNIILKYILEIHISSTDIVHCKSILYCV